MPSAPAAARPDSASAVAGKSIALILFFMFFSPLIALRQMSPCCAVCSSRGLSMLSMTIATSRITLLMTFCSGVLDVHDGHAVQQDADQQRADDDVADPAAPARQADAAEHHDQDDVVDQVEVATRVFMLATEAAVTRPAR